MLIDKWLAGKTLTLQEKILAVVSVLLMLWLLFDPDSSLPPGTRIILLLAGITAFVVIYVFRSMMRG